MHPINIEITLNLTSAGSRLARLLVTVLLVAALPSVAGAHDPEPMAHGPLTDPPTTSTAAWRLSEPSSPTRLRTSGLSSRSSISPSAMVT